MGPPHITPEPNFERPTFAYDAFISYRRRDGGWHARTLRQRLLKVGIPRDARPGREERRLNIYLDTIYERATEDFFENTIKPALRESRHLVVVQSRSASEVRPDGSPNWLVREIEYFKTLPPAGRSISVAITSGDLGAELPAGLEKDFPNIQRLDLRGWRRYWPPGTDEPILTLGATLHGVDPVHMPLVREEEAKAQASQWRVRASITGAVAVALIGLLVWAAILYTTSEARRRTATSRLLAAESMAQLDRQLDLALLLSVNAHVTDRTLESEAALLTGLLKVPRLERVYHGARGQVQRVAMGSDGRFAAAVDNTGALTVWRVDDGRQAAQEILADGELIEAVAFHPDGRRIVTATPGGVLQEWQISDSGLRSLSRISDAGIIQVLGVSPDGRFIVTGDLTGEVRIRNFENLSMSRLLTGHSSGVTSIAFSRETPMVATGALNGSVVVQSLSGESARSFVAHGKGVFGLSLDGSGATLITSGLDGRVLLWALNKPENPAIPLLEQSERTVALAADWERAAVAVGTADGRVIKVSTRGEDAPQETFKGHTGFVRALEFSSDGKLLLSGASDGRVLAWRPHGPDSLVQRVFAHQADPQAVRFGSVGRFVASADLSAILVLWREDGGQLERHDFSAQLDEISSMSLSPDNRLLAMADYKGSAIVFAPGASAASIPAAAGAAARVHFRSNDELLLVAPTGKVTAISWPKGTTRKEAPVAMSGELLSSAISQDGRWLALGDNKGELALVDADDVSLVRTVWKGHTGSVLDLSFSSDGRMLASVGDDGNLSIWDVATGTRQYDPLRDGEGGRLFSVAFWPKRPAVVTGDENGLLRVWDLRERRTIGPPIPAHNGFVQALGFSEDGASLASAGTDGILAIWEVESEAWVSVACRMANRKLTSPEQDRGFAGDAGGDPCQTRAAGSRWPAPKLPSNWPRPAPALPGSSVVAVNQQN